MGWNRKWAVMPTQLSETLLNDMAGIQDEVDFKEDPYQLSAEDGKRIAVLAPTLACTLDETVANRLLRQVRRIVEGGRRGIILDCCTIRDLEAGALSDLQECSRVCREAGGLFLLAEMTDAVHACFKERNPEGTVPGQVFINEAVWEIDGVLKGSERC